MSSERSEHICLPVGESMRPEHGLSGIVESKRQDWRVNAPFRIQCLQVTPPIRGAGAGRARVIAAALLGLVAAGPALAEGRILLARGSWAAIQRGDGCVAAGRSARVAARGKVRAVAGFSFTPDRRRWGEFHAHLSRVPRAGSSVILKVGNRPFLLTARGDWAWSRGPAQEQAIIAAVRSAGGMRIEARDGAGRRFADPYALDGAPTAIDAAAACAGKIARR